MRILHVISSVGLANGGPIEGVKQLSLVAIQNGHDIEVASCDAPEASFLKTFPVPVHALGPPTSNYAYTPRLLPWLRANYTRYDVIVVNGIWQYHGFATWRALSRTNTPYVVFTHGMLDPWFKRTYPLKHLKKWLYWPWGEYRVLRDAEAVLFTCEEERIVSRESFWLYSARERTINYGTSSPVGDPEIQKRHFHESFPELEGKRIALFMGRIHPKKGCDIAIKAFATVLGRDPNWRLVMAGPDQVGWTQELKALAHQLGIANRITWTGMITGDAKAGALLSSEFLFLPSHQENFGIVVAEALACALPVLISNKVNIWREIQRFGAGLVGEDNLVGAQQLLRSWLQIPDAERTIMRCTAQACFQEEFEIHRASTNILSVLHDVKARNDAASDLVHQSTTSVN